MENNVDLSEVALQGSMMHYKEVFKNPTNFYKGCVQEAKYFYEGLVATGVLTIPFRTPTLSASSGVFSWHY